MCWLNQPCDTAADPTLGSDFNCAPAAPCNVDSNCLYTGSETDSCNADPYTPQTWNLMSYSPQACKTAFTADQGIRAVGTHVASRIPDFSINECACGQMVWVDVNGDAIDQGTQFYPFHTIAQSLPFVCNGGTLFVKPGYYAEAPLFINQSMTIRAHGGTVEIRS